MAFKISPTVGPAAFRDESDYGYHVNCRFDQDTFSYTAVGPNQNQLSLNIAEFNAVS